MDTTIYYSDFYGYYIFNTMEPAFHDTTIFCNWYYYYRQHCIHYKRLVSKTRDIFYALFFSVWVICVVTIYFQS